MQQTEFDLHAEQYYLNLKQSITASGENPEFFAEYKVKDLYNLYCSIGFKTDTILDFGCGIGNSIPWFRKYFAKSTLLCSDVSAKSLDIAKQRFPGNEKYIHINSSTIPLDNNSIDIVFTTCVFHHIPKDEHETWLAELKRVLKPGGVCILFEHNTRNPLTVKTVKDCIFDKNACLLTPSYTKTLFKKLNFAGIVHYRIFFPHSLKFFRFLEKYMLKIPFAAQYYIFSIKK